MRTASGETETTMERDVTGRIYWDSTDAEAPQWRLAIDSPSDHPPRILSLRGMDLPHNADRQALSRLIADTLWRVTQEMPHDVGLIPLATGHGYTFRVTYL
jgi:hypothetical protein